MQDDPLSPPPEHLPMDRLSRIPLRFLAPNLITLLALCSGVTAIRVGLEGRYQLAVSAVILAIVLDAVDGRLARYLKGTSRFGAELDSLADFVNFGVAPAILIYFWALNHMRTMGWVAALMLSIGCALRLARFNVMLDDPKKPAWAAGFFTGIPAPAGAGLAMVPFYMGFLGLFDDAHRFGWIIAPYLMLVAFLMVSRVPTFSGKAGGSAVPRENYMPMLAAAAMVIVLLVAFPWTTLLIIWLGYILLIPFSIHRYRQLKKQDEAAAAAGP